MSPIPLGILAASGAAPAGAFELISTQVLTANTATITFSSIPQGFKHLQVRLVARSSYPDSFDSVGIAMNINGVSTANYAYHFLRGNGSSVSSGNMGSPSSALIPFNIPTNHATANAYGAGVIDILDYAVTTKNKTIRSLSGYHSAVSTRQVQLASGFLTNSTSAITSFTLSEGSGSFAFTAGSRFSLYGIKG